MGEKGAGAGVGGGGIKPELITGHREVKPCEVQCVCVRE